MNKVVLIGRAGSEPEIRKAGDVPVANFSLATSEIRGKGDDRKEETEWHRIQVWGKLAEICASYVYKGQLLAVEGKIKTRKWKDKEGNDKQSTEIVAEQVQMLSKQDKPASKPQPAKPELNNDIDDIPF